VDGDGGLERELDEVAGHLNALHARLLDATIYMLEQPSRWQGAGLERPQQYLCWRTGIAPERAKQIVDIAERAGELPECVARFRAGELSVDQMTAIARRAPWWTDGQLSDLARKLTVWQLRRLLARYPFPSISADDAAGDGDADAGDPCASVDPLAHPSDDAGNADPASEAPVEPSAGRAADACAGEASACGAAATGRDQRGVIDAAAAPNRVWFGFGDDGRFRLRGEFDQATGLVIESALVEARDHLFQVGNGDVDWADAAREIAERSLDRIEAASRRDRFRVHAHLDRTGELTDRLGRALPDVIRRWITCDGVLSPVFHDGETPISVGRSQRIVPERTRRIVLLRDQGCRVPGCGADRHLDVHHIIHWEDWGRTETPNLISLCARHHRMHHRGRLGIAGDADAPDGVTFTNRHGVPITPSGARPEPPGEPPPPISGSYEHPLGECFDGRWFEFREPQDTGRRTAA
jgi:hypothetical protein